MTYCRPAGMVLNMMEPVKPTQLLNRLSYKPLTYNFENSRPNPKIWWSHGSVCSGGPVMGFYAFIWSIWNHGWLRRPKIFTLIRQAHSAQCSTWFSNILTPTVGILTKVLYNKAWWVSNAHIWSICNHGWLSADDALGASRGSDKWASHTISLCHPAAFSREKKFFLTSTSTPNASSSFSYSFALPIRFWSWLKVWVRHL